MNITARHVAPDDIGRMSDALYVYSHDTANRKRSKFWVLLILSAAIAAAGILLDSTATVIGAMIVAPLMTPILGTAFALVLSDRRNVFRSAGLVLAGALSVIVVAYLFGVADPASVVAETNDQVAARVSPGIIDLCAALATGVVGAFALVRSDVSDTLPGVAIAISLVPPLAVVGLTLESGAPEQALGALLLFATNVAAIIATGTLVLLIYPVRSVAQESGWPVGVLRGRTLFNVGFVVVLVAVPLLYGSITVWLDMLVVREAQPVAEAWAEGRGWQVTDVAYDQDHLTVVVLASTLEFDPTSLRTALDEAGLEDVPVNVTMVVGGTRELAVSSIDVTTAG